MSNVASHPYRFQLIPAGDIRINTLYQRGLEIPRVKRLVQQFDWHLVNPVKVIRRDGEWYAVDGQHTTAMLYTKFGADYMVPCLVYEDIGNWVDEARIFIKGNDKMLRKVLSLRDEWKALLVADDERATNIKRLCGNYNLRIPTAKGENGNGWIGSVSSLERVYDSMSAEKFNEFLYILTGAWAGRKDSLLAPIIGGLGRFVNVYYGEYNRAALIKRLKNTEPKVIITAGKASAAQGQNKYAREILNVYNRKTTVGRLPDKLG